MSGQYAHDAANRLGRMNAGLVAAQLITTRSFNMKVTFKQLTKFIYNLLGLSSWVLANLFMGYTGFVFMELGDTLSGIMGVCMLVAVSASFVMLIMYTFYLTTKKGSA